MNLQETEDVLVEVLKNSPLTPHLWGSTGIGKTAIVLQACNRLAKETKKEWACIPVRLGQFEPGELVGKPDDEVVEMPDGKTIKIMSWSCPSYFPRGNYRPCEICLRRMACKLQAKGGVCESGVLFFDEITRAQENDTIQCIFQIIEPTKVFDAKGKVHYEHRLHTHILPPGFRVVAAANPPTANYLVCEYDDAFMARFAPHIQVVGEVRQWLGWANKKESGEKENIRTDALRAFITEHNEMLYEKEPEFDMKVKRNPRSMEFMDILLSNCEIPERLLREVLYGIVGTEATTAYMTFLQDHYQRPVNGKEVIESYPKFRGKVLDDVNAGRFDKINVTLNSVITFCDANTVEGKRFSHFKEYMADLPDDLKFALVKKMLKSENQTFVDKIKRDAEIVKIIEKLAEGAGI